MLAIEISNLYKTYHKDVKAVNGLSLSVEEGSFFGLLGPNGSGKTTTLGIISSLVNKDSGVVKVMGYDLNDHPYNAKSFIGLVPQEFNFSIFETLLDILINQAGYFGIKKSIALERAEKYLELLGLSHKKNSKSGQLSGGMKRRLMIARAMMHLPKILILDEPSAGLDIETRLQIWEFLTKINEEDNVTIILTTHYLEEAERLCKNIAIIDAGKIVKRDTTENILSSFSRQRYVAEIYYPLDKLPVLEGVSFKLRDPRRLEIDFESPYNISYVMKYFSDHKIDVQTLALQGNRLEELFLESMGKKR